MQLSNWTEPEPDIAVFKPRPDFYEEKRATADDVLLVIEISEMSLRDDRYVKLPYFAAAGVSEVWIQNVNRDVLLVFRDPRGDSDAASTELKRGDFISPLAFPEIRFPLEAILGRTESRNLRDKARCRIVPQVAMRAEYKGLCTTKPFFG